MRNLSPEGTSREVKAPPPQPKRFVVEHFDTNLTSQQCKLWGETKLEDDGDPA